jgi:hypothetical protein
MLSWAALEKARNLSSVTETIRLLGCPPRLSRAAAWSLVIAEIGIVIGLVYDRSSAWTQAGIAAIAIAFASAGILALRIGKPIRCNCFGTGKWSALGPKQIATLPIWLFAAALLSLEQYTPSLEHAAIQVAAVGLCLAALRAPAVLRTQREAFADRRSARETYAWLR